MKKWQIIIIVFIALIILGAGLYFYKNRNNKTAEKTTTPRPSSSSGKEFTFDDKIALASFYGWYYKDPAWAELTKADHPLAGSYYPTDDKVIDYQLSMAKDVGLDGFLYSWNGTENPSNEAFIKMLDKIDKTSAYSDFKMAVLYENLARNFTGPNKTPIDELSYLVNLSKEHDSFLKINNLPVIFIYNFHVISAGRWGEILSGVKSTAGDAYLIAMPDNWESLDDYSQNFKTEATYADKYVGLDFISTKYENLKKQGKPLIATLIGGTSTLEKGGFKAERSNGQYLNARYEIAKKNNANWLYITSWNEWYEFSTIEPSRESKFEAIKYLRPILEDFKSKKFSEMIANWTVSVGTQTQIKNDGPGNIYYVRCGMQDKSLLLDYLIRPGEVQTYNQVCPEVSGWLLNNTKLEYKK